MAKEFKSILSVSLITILSRITGLLRDVLLFAALGANIWSSAFIAGFTIPNLFRRLFGEGALSSSFIPVFSTILESKKINKAFLFFNQFIIRWGIYLILVAIICMVLTEFFLSFNLFSDSLVLSAEVFQFLTPYMVFICLSAIISGALNVLGKFWVSSFSPVLFNVIIVAFILVGVGIGIESENFLILLCIGVLVGGLFQLIFTSIDLFRQGWKFDLCIGNQFDKESYKTFWKLFMPGLFGAALLQINILISRLLALSLDDTAVSFLYISSRLMELPLGIFTIAIVTVFFPQLSRLYASKSNRDFKIVLEKRV